MVAIIDIVLSPPGRDVVGNLNGEYVVLQNQGFSSINMRDWQLRDAAGHRYVFSNLLPNGRSWTLGPKEYVCLHTGKGQDSYVPPNTFHLYWGQGWWIWNNKGDTAYLFDQAGNLVDSKTVRGAA